MRMIPMMLGSLLNTFDWNLVDESSEDLDTTERFGISLQKATPLRIVPVPLCLWMKSGMDEELTGKNMMN
ncbi:geraniol 8-hydroxylase [Artemisia annua]|uniref:Geraniol 8-hydroxylase n=1 Tax=Artemisia annua TaxID=35608 RepID=A0A2U1QAY1_ARTAN|nr:geraniol 8-hydroxylase [Artemisia annua]